MTRIGSLLHCFIVTRLVEGASSPILDSQDRRLVLQKHFPSPKPKPVELLLLNLLECTKNAFASEIRHLPLIFVQIQYNEG
jgi:hypothetical protein